MSKTTKTDDESSDASDASEATPLALPTCPGCGIEGAEHIRSTANAERGLETPANPWLEVVYCTGCGHVYTAIAKHVYARRTNQTSARKRVGETS